jgi:hypothetical protein
MRLWRGEPDHSHWKALIKPRDRAWGLFALALVSAVMAWSALHDGAPRCATGGKLVCSATRTISGALGSPLAATEAVLWGGGALFLLLLGLSQWRNR